MPFAIEPAVLVTDECIAITTAMRKNSRWVHSGIAAILGVPSRAAAGSLMDVSDDSAKSDATEFEPLAKTLGLRRTESFSDLTEMPKDTLLVLGLASLRAELVTRNVKNIPAPLIVRPFTAILQSHTISKHVHELCLSALTKFFALGVLGPDSPDIANAVQDVVFSTTQFPAEKGFLLDDDTLLLRLVQMLDCIITCPCGNMLSAKAAVSITESCLELAFQRRRNEILRRSIVNSVIHVIRLVYGKLANETQDGAKQRSSNDLSFNHSQAALDILHALLSYVDPSKNVANATRVTGLRILRIAFETGGRFMAEDKRFVKIVASLLWKHILQLVRRDHATLVDEALHLAVAIIQSGSGPYKRQIEFLLVYLLTCLTPFADLPRDENVDKMFFDGVPRRPHCVGEPAVDPESGAPTLPAAAQKSYEVREVIVDALTLMTASPDFFTDLYYNYDCDPNFPDLAIDLLGFLCRNAYPDSATWSTASVPPLCLEAVLCALQSWAARISNTSDPQKELAETRKRKALEITAADAFNKNPAKGSEDMVKMHIIEDMTPASVAQFLHTSQHINKGVLGQFLSKSVNSEVLDQYIKAFSFDNKRIDEAMREFLCSFRLPGESRQIENIFERFARQYIAGRNNTEFIRDADSAFVLAYAILMLNTDQHSPQVKFRMSFESFKTNLREANGGEDFDTEFLKTIYDAICTREIVLPDEHDTDETFEIFWKQIQAAAPCDAMACSVSSSVDRLVFAECWRAIVSTLSFVFATAGDDLVISRIIHGFQDAARLAVAYKTEGAIDHILECLGKISTLASGNLEYPLNNIEVQIKDQFNSLVDTVVVSDLSVAFGGDLKAQMASITLFRLAINSLSAATAAGAGVIVKALTNLYLYDLAIVEPPVLAHSVPYIQAAHIFEKSRDNRPTGLFSALSNYLTSSTDFQAPSDEDIDAASGASECAQACRIEEVTKALVQGSGRFAVVAACLSLLPGEEEEVVEDANGQFNLLTSPRDSIHMYLPASAFLLELAYTASIGDEHLMSDVYNAAEALVIRINETGVDLIGPFKEKEEVTVHEAVLHVIGVALRAAKSTDLERTLEKVGDLASLDQLLTLPPSSAVWKRLRNFSDKSDVVKVYEYAQKQLSDNAVSESTLPEVIGILAIVSESGITSAVEKLTMLSASIENPDLYLALLSALSHAASAASPLVRDRALEGLQRLALSPDEAAQRNVSGVDVLDSVLIPQLLERLLQPEIYQRDPKGMAMTRQQVSSLVGKAFLQFAMVKNDMEPVWPSVLHALDRLLSSRHQPALRESVEEMTKNIVLVLKVANKGSPEFWEQTDRILKGFLPSVAQFIREKTEAAGAVTQHAENSNSVKALDQVNEQSSKPNSSMEPQRLGGMTLSQTTSHEPNFDVEHIEAKS